MLSEAQKKAHSKYRREKCKSITVQFYPADLELYEWIRKKDNKNGYIRDMLKKEMEKEKHLDER